MGAPQRSQFILVMPTLFDLDRSNSAWWHMWWVK